MRNTIRRVPVALAATVIVVTTSGAAASFAHAGPIATVPNQYRCSYQTNQCWQTNPPHVASIINRCTWSNDRVVNAASASATCDKYTSR